MFPDYLSLSYGLSQYFIGKSSLGEFVLLSYYIAMHGYVSYKSF